MIHHICGIVLWGSQVSHGILYIIKLINHVSGVIFALKVLTTHYDRSGQHYFMGTPIGSKYIVWAELLYIQMISPNASFVGHLAGILVGLAYIYGPLKPFIEFIYGKVKNFKFQIKIIFV